MERIPILDEQDNQRLDWESFKKQYYNQEHILQASLKVLNELHSDISRKLTQLDKSDPICEEDELYEKQQFQSIDLRKYQDQFDEMNQIMIAMSRMLNQFQIGPEEAQSKLKNNMLKRYKEIHQEHEKEVSKLKQSMQTNIKKYDLFKEAIKNNNGSINKKQKRDFELNDYLQRGVSQASHVLDIAQTVHSSLSNQGYRLEGIQHKVNEYMGKNTEYLGQFESIGQLINGIRYHRNKSQIILISLVALLFVFIVYQILY